MNKKKTCINNQNGSVIVVTLLILSLMTVIGISASSTVVQESFITRNAGLYNQNTYLSEAAVMETIQRLLGLSWHENPDQRGQLLPYQTTLDWIYSAPSITVQQWDDWYDPNATARFLDDDNSSTPPLDYIVPLSIQNDNLGIINIRNEKGNEPLRCSVVLEKTNSDLIIHELEGKVICEYVSIHGIMRMESGVRVKFSES